ncbi:fructosamine-3-kinase isoform X2 [Ornithorhynchus anatinus]|uniref:fructosamine-3-kinase isoform X2 n=1 Tax=Ornithorhynchus anatinus TaxID=9258 RepID=UPI0010A8F7FB|nr:fructosamine-3-kinase isoform X2 [Ornithorhynchus anatinus]
MICAQAQPPPGKVTFLAGPPGGKVMPQGDPHHPTQLPTSRDRPLDLVPAWSLAHRRRVSGSGQPQRARLSLPPSFLALPASIPTWAQGGEGRGDGGASRKEASFKSASSEGPGCKGAGRGPVGLQLPAPLGCAAGLLSLCPPGPCSCTHGVPPEAREMFEGEVASLEALRSTGILRVPQPLKVVALPGGGAALIMEYLAMRSLSSHSAALGDQIADLHLYNQKLREKVKKEEKTVGKGAGAAEPKFVDQFGFHTVTCCGYIPQRLQIQLDLIEKDYGDREARELWSQLQLKIPELFGDEEIVPALLHGDLWAGNMAEDDSGPMVFDPASFYGHSEFDLAISFMFGGLDSSFFSAYHRKIPQAPGFARRLQLYKVFNYVNHWNHFGSGYRGVSLGAMRKLLKSL